MINEDPSCRFDKSFVSTLRLIVSSALSASLDFSRVQLCSCRSLTTAGAALLRLRAHHSTTRTPVDHGTCSHCLLHPMVSRRAWRSMHSWYYYILPHTVYSIYCMHWSKLGFSSRSAEIDQKLQEIMKQTGYLKIDGQVRPLTALQK